MDEGSRTPESLARSLAMTLNSVGHPKAVQTIDAFLVLSPEHWAIFREGGWNRARIKAELMAATARPGSELVRGANGVDAGVKPELVEDSMTKFREGGLNIVRAGGRGRAHERYHRGMGGERPPRHQPRHERGEILNSGFGREQSPAGGGSGSVPITREMRSRTRASSFSTRRRRPHPVRRERRFPPPSSLEGVTLGLLDIGKARGNTFLDRLESTLRPGRGLCGETVREAHQYPHRADRSRADHRRGGRCRRRRLVRLRLVHVVQCA